jgi:hypothetical protein
MFGVIAALTLPGAHRVTQRLAGPGILALGDRLAQQPQHIGRQGDGDFLGAWRHGLRNLAG